MRFPCLHSFTSKNKHRLLSKRLKSIVFPSLPMQRYRYKKLSKRERRGFDFALPRCSLHQIKSTQKRAISYKIKDVKDAFFSFERNVNVAPYFSPHASGFGYPFPSLQGLHGENTFNIGTIDVCASTVKCTPDGVAFNNAMGGNGPRIYPYSQECRERER